MIEGEAMLTDVVRVSALPAGPEHPDVPGLHRKTGRHPRVLGGGAVPR